MLQRAQPETPLAGSPGRLIRAPRESSASSAVANVPPVTFDDTRRLRLTASLAAVSLELWALDAGPRRVASVLQDRSTGDRTVGATGHRDVALVPEGGDRLAGRPARSVRDFAGDPVDPESTLGLVCRIVGKLPRELLVDLILVDRRDPLRLARGLSPGALGRLARALEARWPRALAEVRGRAGWAALVAECAEEEEVEAARTLREEPRISLLPWFGRAGFDAVKIPVPGGTPLFRRESDGLWLEGPAGRLGLGGPAAAAAAILARLPAEVVVDLHENHGEDALREVREIGEGATEGFASFLEKHFQPIKTIVTWIMAVRSYRAFRLEGSCYSAGVDPGDRADALEHIVGHAYRNVQESGATLGNWASALASQVTGRAARSITAEDVAAFAASGQVRGHPLVESVSMAGSRVRVVLREPIYATVIAHGGRTYKEREPGTCMRQHPMAAFDLVYGQSSFPNAYVWANKECTVAAKHSNIQASVDRGRLCLGDLGYSGNEGATLYDLVRMVKVWNLDSPYNSSPSFLMQRPAARPEGWRGSDKWVAWQPGMVEIEMGFTPHPAAPEGPGAAGSYEEVED